MRGSWIDVMIATMRGRRRQESSLYSEQMQLMHTQSGILRVLDTGGKHPPLMIVPDGPCVLEHYTDLITVLSPDFRVICFELPGFGFSYPTLNFDFSVAQMAETVIEVMNQLKVPVAILAFTCANGFVALYAAKHHPNRISHLVLGQTPSFDAMRQWNDEIIPKIFHVPYMGQLIAAGVTRKMAAGWYDLALPRRSALTTHFKQQADRALQTGGCFCLSSLVQGLRRTQNTDISNVSTPTLLIYGNRDRSHQRTDFSSLRDHAPTAEVKLFQGCGHFPDLEQPQDYAQQIKRFVV